MQFYVCYLAFKNQNFEVVPLLVEDYQAAIAQMVSLNIPGGGIFDASGIPTNTFFVSSLRYTRFSTATR
jgi:hypothetical protein